MFFVTHVHISSLSFFLLTNALRYQIHYIKSSHCKCTIQGFFFFGKFIERYNYLKIEKLVLDFFPATLKVCCAHLHFIPTPTLSLRQPVICFLSQYIYFCWNFRMKWNHTIHGLSHVVSFTLSNFFRLFHVVACVKTSLLFHCWRVFHCRDVAYECSLWNSLCMYRDSAWKYTEHEPPHVQDGCLHLEHGLQLDWGLPPLTVQEKLPVLTPTHSK
jgi:hypothetical protein